MCWKLVRLDFGNNLAHFGELGIGIEETSERVRSDTLFSAWISAYARLYGKDAVGELLDGFVKNSDSVFRISSTFIYAWDGDKYTYYLPKPLVLPKGYPDDDLNFTKAYKKLNYLPLKIWHRWYQTEEGFIDEQDGYELELKTNNYPGKKGILCKSGTFDYNQAFQISLVPKVAVDRVTRATNFYHTGFVQYLYKPDEEKQSGLYFLIKFSEKVDETLVEKLKLALDILGEEGLGGERSSGGGRFKAEWVDFDSTWKDILNPSEVTNPHYCLISLYWQKTLPSELLAPSAVYEIQGRTGWIASPFSGRQLRRQSLRMFAEGSVFPISPKGELADVTPAEFKKYPDTHKIYRSGISLSLPINIRE